MRRHGLLLLLLAGCPPKSAPISPLPPPTAGVGCPAASGVFIASYLTPDEGGKGHTGWVLPLADTKVDAIAGQPDYLQLDATRAGALGVPLAPPSVWLLMPGGAPPCKASIGAYYSAAVDAATPNVTYGVELGGCAAPPPEQAAEAEAIALASDAPPSECTVTAPHPAAARLGQMDAQKRWQRPAQETPIPAPLAALVPPHDCRPPGCEPLWSIAQVDVGGKAVAWAGAVNWLAIPAGEGADKQCTWKAEAFSGFFVAGPDGAAQRVTEGQDHPLLLTAVLADKSGAKVLVAEGAGEYATYDLAGGAKLARHLVWLLLAPEAYAVDDRLGPQCGPEAPPDAQSPPPPPPRR